MVRVFRGSMISHFFLYFVPFVVSIRLKARAEGPSMICPALLVNSQSISVPCRLRRQQGSTTKDTKSTKKDGEGGHCPLYKSLPDKGLHHPSAARKDHSSAWISFDNQCVPLYDSETTQ